MARVEQVIDSTHHSNLIASSHNRNYPLLKIDVGSIAHSNHDLTTGISPATNPHEIQSSLFARSLRAVLDSAFVARPQNGTVTEMLVDLDMGNISDDEWQVSPDPRFLHTGSQKPTNQSTQKDESQSLEQELQACHDLESSTALLCTALARRLGKLLACPQEDFTPSSSIAQFGIDSLVAAELRAWIFQSLGSSIKIDEILGRDNLTEIAQKMALRSSLIGQNLVETIGQSPKMVQEQIQAPNGTREHLLSPSDEYLSNGSRHTLCYQDSLPKMSVPSLQTTLEKYVLSTRPLLTDAEHKVYKTRVDDFGKEGGVGEVLQARLETRSMDPKIKNWLYEYWVTHYYLNPRKPIAPATNFFMAHEETVIAHSMAKRAAIITRAVIDFKNKWDKGTLEPAMLHDAPICMESYHWLFNTCRIPKVGGDESRKAQTSNHITVIWRNTFLRLETEQYQRILEVWELESLFSHILEGSATTPEAGFGVLSTENRDTWAQVSLPCR